MQLQNVLLELKETKEIYPLAQGGTAVGTGINTKKDGIKK